MKKENGRMFKLGVIFFSLLVFVVSTGGALGVVWLRQQISRRAESCMSKEKELVTLQRTHIYLQSAIAQVHNPEYLKEKVGNRLTMPNKQQIVWVQGAVSKGKNHYVAGKGNLQSKSLTLKSTQYNRVMQ